jgi:uracil-DNA glycosylase
MTARPLHEIVEAGWAEALAPAEERIAAMGEFRSTSRSPT